MGDSFGGVIAGVLRSIDSGSDFRALVRLGEAGGVPPWQYESAGALLRPAQAADGTLYAIEYVPGLDQFGDRFWDTHAIVIDGRTGRLIARRPFPRDVETYVAGLEEEGFICTSTRVEGAPATVGPIVGSDGRGYLLIRRRLKHMLDSCIEQTAWPQRTIDNGVDLIILSPDAPPVVEPIFSEACNVPRLAQAACDTPAFLTQVVPDGIGGVLAIWGQQQTVVTRRDEAGGLVDTPMEMTASIHSVGQNGIVYVPLDEGYGAIDITTWTPIWATEGPYAPLAAHPDGGAALFEPWTGTYQTVNSAGQRDATSLHLPLRWPVQQFGNWIGASAAGLLSVAGQFPDASRWIAGGGNQQGQAQVRNPGVGIFLKSHWAFEGVPTFKHFSIRIVPSAQAFWRGTDPSGFLPEDVYGNRFMTLGAGTGPDDTHLGCSGTLTKGKNRNRDVIEAASSLDQYPVSRSHESEVIWSLIEAFNRYADNLPYACFPESNPGSYNSNSFARGLQDVVGLPTPSARPNLVAPGWFTPVPARYFGVGQ